MATNDDGRQAVEYGDQRVAFCTQNIIPGIDFTNDPLLQGRNFSYLDTQLKRLGSPNFTHLPVNAPKCPIAHFQQDGHMAMMNPQGRVNYEPNSWDPPGPAGVSGLMDDGFISLEKHSAADFIARCAELRYWPRARASDKAPAGARA